MHMYKQRSLSPRKKFQKFDVSSLGYQAQLRNAVRTCIVRELSIREISTRNFGVDDTITVSVNGGPREWTMQALVKPGMDTNDIVDALMRSWDRQQTFIIKEEEDLW